MLKTFIQPSQTGAHIPVMIFVENNLPRVQTLQTPNFKMKANVFEMVVSKHGIACLMKNENNTKYEYLSVHSNALKRLNCSHIQIGKENIPIIGDLDSIYEVYSRTITNKLESAGKLV